VFAALLVIPSLPLAVWFGVLYHYHANGLGIGGLLGAAMVLVGITFVVNSLDSLIRLYTDNLGLGVARLGRARYLAGNVGVLFGLTLLFQLDFLRIQWVGSLVIALYVTCVVYILTGRRRVVAEIGRPRPMPARNAAAIPQGMSESEERP
jgi:hypothetical protein